MTEDEKNSVTPERVNERLTKIGTISLFFSVLFSLINFLTLRSTNLNFGINLLQNYVPLVIFLYLMYIVYETSNSGIEFFQKINKKNLFKVTLLECISILNVLATLPTSKKLPIKIIFIFFIFYVIGFFIALKGRNSEKKCCVIFSLLCFLMILIAPFLLSLYDLWGSKDYISLVVSILVFSIVLIVGLVRREIKNRF